VNFQQSISVKGFNTGQATTVSAAAQGIKKRGGIGMRRRKLKEMEMNSADSGIASSDVRCIPSTNHTSDELGSN
jgi:hypothetical protein